MKNLLLTLILVSLVNGELKIGTSLHPYFSFVSNIVQDKATVIPLTDGTSNPHAYQITPNDIERTMGLDVVVLNGVGHDEFAAKMLKAAGVFKKVDKIYANDGVALMPQFVGSETVNSHTFVSISASIQQIYTIANSLAKIDPANGQIYKKNASNYARTLRMLKSEFMGKIVGVEGNDFRCATIHGGYSYLLQEFGFQVEAVIEPSHGINPTASQLRETIEKINSANVRIVFSEQDFPSSFISTIKAETGVSVVSLSHLSSGDFTPDSFENGMRYNLEKLYEAVSSFEEIKK
jgi:zinc transport system substrate-binding protein